MLPSEMKIRLATEADLPVILQLYAQRDMEGRALSLEEALPLFREILTSDRQELFVAEGPDGQILGSFSLSYVQHLTHGGARSVSLGDIVVKSESQRLGVGTRMMTFAAQRARERGCYKLMLSSATRRLNAQAFYESVGYERHGISYLLSLDQGE
jgi:ribosomal protein S18 acetylase RimI-like enzyme